MIRKVSFRNFKAYRSLDVELEPFTVLVGPNASGKTTLLEGLHLVSQTARMLGGGWGYWPASPRIQSYGVKTPAEISVHGQWGGAEGFMKASGGEVVEPQEPGKPYLPFRIMGEWRGRKFSAGNFPGAESRPITPDLYVDGLDKSDLHQLQAALVSTAILQFEADRLAGVSYSTEAIPHIESNGSGLASVLAYLKLSRDEVFEEIERALRGIVPTVRRVRIDRALVGQMVGRPEEQRVWGDQLVFDMQGAKGVSADAAGEGTLMALGLLTALLGPPQPRLVLLDDIELKLHPAAQAKLVEVLRAIQKRDSGVQIVATSHSPFILNYLDPAEVRMTFLGENGFARCEKLTAHPEFEKWKDLMSPGEFWSTVGENWLEKAGETSASE
jgi:predicted ATPase